MAYFEANQSLCRDMWPSNMGKPILPQGDVPAWKKLPTEFEELIERVSVSRMGSQSPQVLLAHGDLEAQGVALRFSIRVQGVVAEANLETLGNWTGDERGVPRAMQMLALTSGGCVEAFDPQCQAIMELESIIGGVLGAARTSRVARRGIIRLKRRVFTKLDNDNPVEAIQLTKKDDPWGKAGSFASRWIVDHRIKVGIQHGDGRVVGQNTLAIRKGDFVDVLAQVDIVSMKTKGGRKFEVQFAPQEVVRLKSAWEAKASAALLKPDGGAQSGGATQAVPAAQMAGYQFQEEMDTNL